ncbi:MAG: hypothetical protein AAB410_04440 [Patescibacteria group bacterium]
MLNYVNFVIFVNSALSYQIFPTLIFFLAIFAAILMVLRRLPEINNPANKKLENAGMEIHKKLQEMGMPALAASKIKHYGVFWLKKIWRFMLEAKEMAPTGASVLKIKNLFAVRQKINGGAALAEEINSGENENKTEQDFLASIQKEPKNYLHYDNLGKFYLSRGQFGDAKDIYLYLTAHASGNPDYWARLGFASFRLKDFTQASTAYKKSLDLDSSHANRYYNLAQSYKALGEIEAAKASIKKALQMDSQNFKFLELLGRLNDAN